MAVLVEAISVVILTEAITRRYPDGWEQFRRDYLNRGLCTDGELTRVGFPTPQDTQRFVEELRRYGIEYLRGSRAADLVVIDQQSGFAVPCDWAELGRVDWNDAPHKKVTVCQAKNTKRFHLITPPGWKYEGSWSATLQAAGLPVPDSSLPTAHGPGDLRSPTESPSGMERTLSATTQPLEKSVVLPTGSKLPATDQSSASPISELAIVPGGTAPVRNISTPLAGIQAAKPLTGMSAGSSLGPAPTPNPGAFSRLGSQSAGQLETGPEQAITSGEFPRLRTGDVFERRVGDLLESRYPHSYLSRVPVFRADAAMLPNGMARELDFILHLQNGRRHTLVTLECKSCRITGPRRNDGTFASIRAEKDWLGHYQNGTAVQKNLKEQLRGQRVALLANLEPLDGEIRFLSVIVGDKVEGLPVDGVLRREELPSFEVALIHIQHLPRFLEELAAKSQVLLVQQSEILRRLRQGQPVPALGHPEVFNAIEYTRRCRDFIDSEIFRHLELKRECWAINGSGGMGTQAAFCGQPLAHRRPQSCAKRGPVATTR